MVLYDIIILVSVACLLLLLTRLRYLRAELRFSQEQEKTTQAKFELAKSKFEQLQEFIYGLEFEDKANQSQALEIRLAELDARHKQMQAEQIKNEIDNLHSYRQKSVLIAHLKTQLEKLEVDHQQALSKLRLSNESVEDMHHQIEELIARDHQLTDALTHYQQKNVDLSEQLLALEKYRSIANIDKDIALRLQQAIAAVKAHKAQVVKAKAQAKDIINEAELTAKTIIDAAKMHTEGALDYNDIIKNVDTKNHLAEQDAELPMTELSE